MNDEPIPMLRQVEVVSVTHEGRNFFLLRDPQGIATEPILLPPASAALLRFFDSRHTTRDIQLALARQSGQIVPQPQIREFVDKLDANFFLESEAYRTRKHELAREYAGWINRPARFAGEAYSNDPETLLRELDDTYRGPGGPGLPEAPVASLPAAVAAPHIDPGRGAPVYANAYASLWGARPRRIVLLGVCHFGATQPFVLTSKSFSTPLGVARTDQVMLQRLVDRLDWDPLEEEELHRWEHSIEFQIIYLQHALGRGGDDSPEPEPQYLPILCSFPWQVFRQGPESDPMTGQVRGFLETLSELIAEDPEGLLIVAGVDLAHMGRRFGDAGSLSDGFLVRLQNRDLATLSRLVEGDRDGFVEETIREQDDRRICGFPALYSLLTLLPRARGRVAGYRQSVDQTSESVVTFAALVYDSVDR